MHALLRKEFYTGHQMQEVWIHRTEAQEEGKGGRQIMI